MKGIVERDNVKLPLKHRKKTRHDRRCGKTQSRAAEAIGVTQPVAARIDEVEVRSIPDKARLVGVSLLRGAHRHRPIAAGKKPNIKVAVGVDPCKCSFVGASGNE
jgi:hypothetical protein